MSSLPVISHKNFRLCNGDSVATADKYMHAHAHDLARATSTQVSYIYRILTKFDWDLHARQV